MISIVSFQALGDKLVVAEKVITVFNEKTPGKIPWSSLKIELVAECTQIHNSKVFLHF